MSVKYDTGVFKECGWNWVIINGQIGGNVGIGTCSFEKGKVGFGCIDCKSSSRKINFKIKGMLT